MADGGGLENRYGVKPIVGSNPTPSALPGRERVQLLPARGPSACQERVAASTSSFSCAAVAWCAGPGKFSPGVT